jgi:hypothetical protein
MSAYAVIQPHVRTQPSSMAQPMMVEVRIRQPQHDCPLYTWERVQECLRVTGRHHTEKGWPADVAMLSLEEQKEIPTFVLTSWSFPPGTLVQARVLGALRSASSDGTNTETLPIDGWTLVTVAHIDTDLASCLSIEQLPPVRLALLQTAVRAQPFGQYHQPRQAHGTVVFCTAEEAAHRLRETRLLLKRERRMHAPTKGWLTREENEQPLVWRAIEGVSPAQRHALVEDMPVNEKAPFAQAEHLIRFVPQRFQHALADLLLPDERLLVFIDRPLLHHRCGLLRLQQWRSNQGLFLVTDRQILWVRDFLSPGTSFLEGGYIAYAAPLERLRNVTFLPAGRMPDELASHLDRQSMAYGRLVMEIASATGVEYFVVHFPAREEPAVAKIEEILHAWLPLETGRLDRRVRRLPVVEPWFPSGSEAERLTGLGGSVPVEQRERLERQLAGMLQASQQELLASALVPALEDYHSPARLVALTRDAVLVLEEARTHLHGSQRRQTHQKEQIQRYDLEAISSVQLSYSLVGSGLHLFLPQADGSVQDCLLPFHSPAIAWFRPLFTRLRLLLSGPTRTCAETSPSPGGMVRMENV